MSTITTTSPVATLTEGGMAVSTFSLTPLTSAATVGISLVGWGGASAADYSGNIEVSMGSTDFWTIVTGNTFVINAGYNSFKLRVQTITDYVQELSDSLVFTVSQLNTTSGLTGSWNVTSQIPLADAAVTARTITLDSANAAYADEATTASATFNIAGGLGSNPNAADGKTLVNVSATGAGAVAGVDYGTLVASYKIGSGSAVPVTISGDQISLPAGTTSFKLSVPVTDDHTPEFGESVTFAVSQTAGSATLTNSWYKASTVTLVDPGAAHSTTYTLTPRTITASATTNATEGNNAEATFSFGGVLGRNVNSVTGNTLVNVDVVGAGATAGVDYGTMVASYVVGSTTESVDIIGGQISLPENTLSFKLSVPVTDDHAPESGESVLFAVSQTADSTTITNSWYKASTANLVDPGTASSQTPVTAVTIIASASNLHTVNEGTNAEATFTMAALGSNANSADHSTLVNVSLTGAAAVAGVDFGTLYAKYSNGNTATITGGQISLPVGTTSFKLGVHVNTDTATEFGESLTFAVSQTADSTTLTNSWYKASTVDIVDAGAATSTTFTGGVGADIFVGAGASDLFVIPGATSLAVLGGFDTIHFSAGDHIDLPFTDLVTQVNVTNITTPFATDVAMLSYFTGLFTNDARPDALVTFNDGNAYVLADTSGNGKFDSTDSFVKVLGIAVPDLSGPLAQAQASLYFAGILV